MKRYDNDPNQGSSFTEKVTVALVGLMVLSGLALVFYVIASIAGGLR